MERRSQFLMSFDSIADVALHDFRGPNLHHSLINPEMDLAPDPPFRAAMPAWCHLRSLSTLMPVMSISRRSGHLDPRYGMFTAKAFWRRDM